jgi:D-alanyl-D-alanine carboxypeptidase/D-alanyl-D-alanine-endopeptidase (penicillin-binding protein 4)
MASSVVSLTCTSRTLFSNLKLITIISVGLQLISCSSGKYISKQADKIILSDTNLTSAHVGISIYDPSTNKYLYNHDGDKYFIPASNTKLFTCYAAMKYLGDSLVGLQYKNFSDTAIQVLATGDPTFLSDDFKDHPVLDFLKKEKRTIYISRRNWVEDALGFGWTWDDYSSSDAAEKSIFPIHHNLVSIKLDTGTSPKLKWRTNPKWFYDKVPNYLAHPFMPGIGETKYGDTSNHWQKYRSFDI